MIISSPSRENNPRLRAIGTIIAGGLFLLLTALWRVQVMHGQHYDNKQDAQSLRRIRIPAARGEIVDRNGVVLANNRPSYDIAIYLDQLGVPKKSNVVAAAQASLGVLGAELGLPATLADRDIKIHYQRRRPLPLPVWRDLHPETVAAFSERASNLPGADLIVMPVRQYPLGALAAHLIGYVGKADSDDDDEIEKFYYYQPDSVGKQGVEKACDEYLRGSPGGRTIRVNPAGTIADDLGEKEAERGGRVTLTIDVRLQRILERALGEAPSSTGKQLSGAAVLLDVRTGEVLASASVPSFDPNIFNPGTPGQMIEAVINNPASPMLNRTIGARYPPGSTFKPITLLAGLESGVISPQDTVVCPGFFTIGNHTFHCWNHSGHGRVDAESAIKESCDVWFYERGLKTGLDNITKVAAEFGLGQPTGFDIGSEGRGLVPSAAWKRTQRGEKWWDGDTVQLSIGQSFLLVTPMQMACVAATFANRGTCLRPYVVKRIESSEGQTVHEGQPDVRTHLSAKPQQIEFVRHAMLGAVQDAAGTAHAASVEGLAVAGKTGTAQYDKTVDGKTQRLDRAWFIGFTPYDQPQVAISVLIEDARDGSHTAAAVASKVFAQIFGKTVEDAHTRGPPILINRYLEMIKRMDWVLFTAMALLAVGSVFFIYSASYSVSGPTAHHARLPIYQMQMVWFGVGLLIYLASALVDYRLICQWATVWYVFALGLLVLVLVAGVKVYGARRWLGIGSFGIQPAEIAKLATLVAISYYLFHRTQETRRQFSTVWVALLVAGAPLLLIMLEPDLGSALVLLPICFGLLLVGGVRVKHLVLVIVLGSILAPFAWLRMKEYQRDRLTVFLHPNKDPLGVGWNLNQSLISVGSGGWSGKGYLQGTQNLLGYLPSTVAPNDFLFSVIAEEKGFTGSLGVVGLYAVILFSGLRIAANARDRLGMLLATGVVVMLFFHVFINVGMTIGLMPVTGLPLPLLSYGGSFVLASMTALGLLQNVWIHRRVY